MTKEKALDMVYDGDLYDAFGYVTADGYSALVALEGVVLQERKTGKWVHVNSNSFKCSVCGNFLDFHGVNAGRGDANYCPNCGAKMEVEE